MAKRDQDADKARNFLSRWSRRKQASEQEGGAPDPVPAGHAPSKEKARAAADSGGVAERPELGAAPGAGAHPAETGTAVEAGEDAEAGFDLKDLPDIDSMEAGSDFTVFLRAGVPDALRRRALRKLWRVHPVLGFIDGLDDYNLDYTDAATVVPNMKTLYQVGRGMILPEDEIAEAEALARAEAQAEAEAAEAEGGSDGIVADDGSVSDRARLSESGETPLTSGAPADTAEALGAAAQSSEPEAAPGKRKPVKRNPGDPVVSDSAAGGNAGRRAAVTRPAARSARSRRWGDSGD